MRRKSKKRITPKINTSSLPDIVFMLLMFFMLVGKVPAPLAQIESEQIVLEGGDDLKETQTYIHVYIGKKDGELVAQIGYNDIVPIAGLTKILKRIRKDEPARNTVTLRIDVGTGIGYIKNEIEPAILEAGINKVIYVLDDEEFHEEE